MPDDATPIVESVPLLIPDLSAAPPLQILSLDHQQLFIQRPEREPLLLDGGFGAGKTTPLCDWAILQCDRYPQNLILVGRQHYTDLADSTVRSFLDRLAAWELPREGWNGSRQSWTHPVTKSEVLFRHLDEESGLKNLDLGGVGIDQAEEIQPALFDLLIGRLRRVQASRQMRLTANPNGHDWLWQLFYGVKSVLWTSPHITEIPMTSPDAREGYKVIRATSLDNPFLPEDYIARLRRDYSEQFVAQYVFGSREIMLGYRYFDSGALRQQGLMEPLRVGHLIDAFPKPEWRDQEGGPVRMYEDPYEHDQYVIGADTATGEGSSWCAGVVLNCTMNRVAAVFDADSRPDELAVQLWLLSRRYQNALIGPERNGIGFSVVTALAQLTGNLFHGKLGDFGTQVGAETAGWLTDARSRGELFAECQRHIAKHSIELRDRILIEQCMAITMGKRGRPDPEPGFRGDLVIALGIALMMRKLRPQLIERITQQATGGSSSLTPVVDATSQGYGFGRGMLKVAGR